MTKMYLNTIQNLMNRMIFGTLKTFRPNRKNAKCTFASMKLNKFYFNRSHQLKSSQDSTAGRHVECHSATSCVRIGSHFKGLRSTRPQRSTLEGIGVNMKFILRHHSLFSYYIYYMYIHIVFVCCRWSGN